MLKSIKFFFQLDHATARTLHGSPGPSSTLFVERLSSGNAGDNGAWDGPGLDELQVSLFCFLKLILLNFVFFSASIGQNTLKTRRGCAAAVQTSWWYWYTRRICEAGWAGQTKGQSNSQLGTAVGKGSAAIDGRTVTNAAEEWRCYYSIA